MADRQRPMNALLLAIDRLSSVVGKTIGWVILLLTALISYEVFSRYALGRAHPWATDVQLMLYGTLFMLGGAYTLSTQGHVRGDIIYGFLPPRGQASIDLALYLLFFFPGVAALAWAGYTFAADAWSIAEHSSITSDGPPLAPFKTVLPLAGALLLLQGFAEVVRCLSCLVDGDWPARGADVQEVDVGKLRRMVGGGQ